MSEHTPGPWEMSKDAVPKDYVQITVYATSDNLRVATVFRELANARLIAAAPELLRTLAELLGAAEVDCMDDKSNVWRNAMSSAQVALAKAEGGDA